MAFQKVTLLNQQPPGIGAAVGCDWQFEPRQQRRFFVVMNAADTVVIEGSADGTQFVPMRAPFTGSNTGFLVVDGPVAAVRARKIGNAGNALVVGLI